MLPQPIIGAGTNFFNGYNCCKASNCNSVAHNLSLCG